MPDIQAVAAFGAQRPVLDEPKAIGPTRAFRASEQRPGPAVPEPDVRQADQLLPVTNLDDGVRRVDLHHAYGAQTGDFHARELVEKPSAIGVLASLSHGDGKASAAATPSAKRAVSRCLLGALIGQVRRSHGLEI